MIGLHSAELKHYMSLIYSLGRNKSTRPPCFHNSIFDLVSYVHFFLDCALSLLHVSVLPYSDLVSPGRVYLLLILLTFALSDRSQMRPFSQAA